MEGEPEVESLTALWVCGHEDLVRKVVHKAMAALTDALVGCMLDLNVAVGDEIVLQGVEHELHIGGAEALMRAERRTPA